MLTIRNSIIALCFVVFVFGCKKESAPIAQLDNNLSPIAQTLLENTALISRVFSDTTIQLHKGVEETDIHYLSMTGYTMRAFVLKVDLKQADVSLMPLTPYGGTSFAMQTVPDMVNYIDSPESKTLAAVNADFFNTSTGEPRSIVYLNGEAIRTIIPGIRGYFGVSKTGELMIGDSLDYTQHKNQISNALGGYQRLIKNKTQVGQTDLSIEPRTAVGFTIDKIVYFIVVDGRRFDYSNGMTLTDLSAFMLALGVSESINLDGGGSSTFMINNPLADVMQVRNWSSDGSPRAVANGWAIVAKN